MESNRPLDKRGRYDSSTTLPRCQEVTRRSGKRLWHGVRLASIERILRRPCRIIHISMSEDCSITTWLRVLMAKRRGHGESLLSMCQILRTVANVRPSAKRGVTVSVCSTEVRGRVRLRYRELSSSLAISADSTNSFLGLPALPVKMSRPGQHLSLLTIGYLTVWELI